MDRFQVYDYDNVHMHLAEGKYLDDDYRPDYSIKPEVGEVFEVDGWTYIDNEGNEFELNHYELEIVAKQHDKIICKIIDAGDLDAQ